MKIERKRGIKEAKVTHNKILFWIIIILLVILIGVLVTLRNINNINRNNEENKNSTIANPASVYCIEHNGTLEIRADNTGAQYGLCIINNTECEEWAYFRGECTPTLYCSTDFDCIPASCCHASSCVNKENAPNCIGLACTMNCEPNTLDCGQASCICSNGKCEVQLENTGRI